MTINETLPSARGRGRPRAEHPLSNAERQKRYRERQKNVDKPENLQTLQRINQLQERIERLESRQQEMLNRMEKRQGELEHRLKSLQTLLTRVVQRLDGTPASSREKASARRKVRYEAGTLPTGELASVSEPTISLVDTDAVLPTSALVDAVSFDAEALPVQYHLHAANRCQIATGREGSQCSGKVSHTVILKLPDGTVGEFGACQIHFRQFLQHRPLIPCDVDMPSPAD